MSSKMVRYEIYSPTSEIELCNSLFSQKDSMMAARFEVLFRQVDEVGLSIGEMIQFKMRVSITMLQCIGSTPIYRFEGQLTELSRSDNLEMKVGDHIKGEIDPRSRRIVKGQINGWGH